ncbi:MAG TPA: hypothetical protein VI653_24795 [Steroidobacteraceae bacterium]
MEGGNRDGWGLQWEGVGHRFNIGRDFDAVFVVGDSVDDDRRGTRRIGVLREVLGAVRIDSGLLVRTSCMRSADLLHCAGVRPGRERYRRVPLESVGYAGAGQREAGG